MTDFETGTLTATATAPTGTGNSASQLILDTVGAGGATFTVPTAAGTVSFWGSGDGGVTWMPLAVTPSSGGTPVTTSSAAGLWAANTSAYTHVAMVATAITGGSISVALHTSTVAGRTSSGGGGPGGMVPPGSTGIVSLTTTGTSGASTYSSSTGILNIPSYVSSGGMVPAGSTGIVSPLITSATSGPATYSPSTGMLSIPNYAPNGLTFNSVQFITTAYSTSSTTAVSSGQGITFTPQTSQPLVAFQVSAQSAAGYVLIARTTAGIPVSGAAIPGTDVTVLFVGNASITVYQYLTGAIYDTGLTPNTPYNYYLGLRVASSGTINLQASGKVQISEFHL